VRPTVRPRPTRPSQRPHGTPQRKFNLSPSDLAKIKAIVNKILDRIQNTLLKQALWNLMNNYPLTPQQITVVTNLVNDSDSGLTSDECNTLKGGLEGAEPEESSATGGQQGDGQQGDGQQEGGPQDGGQQGNGDDRGDSAPAPVKQTRRFLRVINNTKEELTVYVQYRTLTADNQFAWLPAPDQAATWTIQAGGAYYLSVKGVKIDASRVRIWAKSATGQWLKYKTQDLWLVSEVDERGEHSYLAAEMQTYTFTFNP
jgi:hypothetical protein